MLLLYSAKGTEVANTGHQTDLVVDEQHDGVIRRRLVIGNPPLAASVDV